MTASAPIPFRLSLLWMLAVLPLSAHTSPAPNAASTGRQPRVLVLYSNERLLPANIITDEAIRSTFQREFKDPVEFYNEFLDADRFPGYQERTRDFLRDKYQERPPDLIIAGGSTALKFLLEYRGSLLENIPIVHVAVSPANAPASLPDDRIVGVPFKIGLVPTLELALRLQPQTRSVAIVSDGGNVNPVAPEELAEFTNQVSFLWLTNYALPRLRDELAQLPDKTIVMYTTLFRDGAGNTFTPQAALDAFAPASRVPVYGNYDTYIGHGIVGGSMVTFQTAGQTAARIAMRILAGETPQSAIQGMAHEPTPMLDWRQLKRWDIAANLLPPGSVVFNRRESIWREHAVAVIVTLAVLVLQSWLIGRLLIQRRQRQRAESELRESEARFRHVADAAPVMIWLADSERKHTYFNQRWLDFTGRSRQQEAGEGWLSGIHPDDVTSKVMLYHKAFESRTPFETEYRLRRHDGRHRWVHARAEPRYSGRQEFLGYVGCCVDITDQKQTEVELHRQRVELAHVQRIAAMGELTALIAHEVSQPLGAILSNAEAAEMLLNSATPPMDQIREILEDIRKDDIRADETIRRIRSLMRRRELVMEPTDMNKTVTEVSHLVAGDAKRRQIAIHLELDPSSPMVKGDKVHLQQVLLNLISNGMDAVRECPPANRGIWVWTSRDGESVEIGVRDSGPGIPLDGQARMFEPFFTTKNNGLGLGLTMVRSIIEAHGGRIWAENKANGGASFRFTLPAAKS